MKKTKILIFAKTYPQPSSKYVETVCAGGALEDGTLIRLFPITFRLLPLDKRFKRYQWIEADIRKSGSDNRKESFRINQDSTKKISPVLSCSSSWAARRRILLKKQAPSLEYLNELHELDGTSLGIIRPKEVEEFRVKPKDLSSQRKAELLSAQNDLFRAELQPLRLAPL
ncbi:MAG: hypothetical protein KAT58_03585 [candidate division Zixibacteria bacterium]|nr:hypothetical protein [candidate division Zixibacteria bacterium]